MENKSRVSRLYWPLVLRARLRPWAFSRRHFEGYHLDDLRQLRSKNIGMTAF